MTTQLTETRVHDNVVVYSLGGDSMPTSYGTNAVAVVGERAVLLVDPLIAPAHGRLIEAALRRRTDAPVRFVVFTHHHTDHTLGAAVFEDRGAALIGHRACREAMAGEHPRLIAARRTQPAVADLFLDARPVLPSITFDESLVLHVGGVEVEVWHPGWGHTPGDAFLFVPEARVAICGDLLFAGYHYNYEHASLTGVREGLRALRALDADVFIPGHGSPGGIELLDQQAAYHDAVEAIVNDALESGQTEDAAAAAIRERFPQYRLGIVTPAAIACIRESRAKRAAR
ncbi:MAG: MBL fold metallo-hydrolase [Armatimonadota bacterium]|nr:MBL fold metallo-hydrolase [Armatimonadota bacterium]MDR7452523.1 MBL fold metallo-hydrolase [Armatimonadota bacterium]MDR7467750.1 MBL fold metallo-hydrolase [Armatimonadota bacterium]MDR7494950.1 MBL fold metallo-hydrolase [Armatimonadota bacterium]MDR7499785.1 MBL fold metallo-hydrolase [Armatimonadota bacterium]